MYMVFVYMCVCVFAEANMKWVLENEKKSLKMKMNITAFFPFAPIYLINSFLPESRFSSIIASIFLNLLMAGGHFSI